MKGNPMGKKGANIKHMRKRDYIYLNDHDFLVSESNPKSRKNANSFKEINYFKKTYLLKYLFEAEETMAFFYETNLINLSRIKLSKLTPEKLGKFVEEPNQKKYINLFNQWFASDYNKEFIDRNEVTVIEAFERFSFGNKIEAFSLLNYKSKSKLFGNSKNGKYNHKKIQMLRIAKAMRDHLSHNYWVLDKKWMNKILRGEGYAKIDGWKGTLYDFFVDFDRFYAITYNNILIDSYILTKKNLKWTSKIILWKNKNKLFHH